jgi:transposase InsO family protein
MASRRSHSTADLALRRRGGLHRADGNPRAGRAITARRKLAIREGSSSRDAFPLYSRDKDVEEVMATVGEEHGRAERLLGAALAEQRRSCERYDAAVGRSDRLLAAVGLHAADQEVAARDAWLRWVHDDGYRGLNAGPFELLVEGSGP